MEDINKTLDSLCEEIGEKTDGTEVLVKPTDAEVDAAAEKLTRKNYVFAYDDNGGVPVPGQNMDEQFDRISDVNKQDAMQSMINQAAILKAQKEKEEARKNQRLTPEERKKKVEDLTNYLFYQAQEQYYVQNHYIMDGRTKRATLAQIKRDIRKGRYKIDTNTGSLNG